MNEIYVLLDYIDGEMRAKRPFGGVNRNAVLEHTAKLRELLGEALDEKSIKEEKYKAQKIVEFAEAKHAQLVEESSIVTDAKQRANDILQKTAQKQAEFVQLTKKTLKNLLEENASGLRETLKNVEIALKNLDNQ